MSDEWSKYPVSDQGNWKFAIVWHLGNILNLVFAFINYNQVAYKALGYSLYKERNTDIPNLPAWEEYGYTLKGKNSASFQFSFLQVGQHVKERMLC